MKLAKLLLEEIITPDDCLGITRDQMPQIHGKDIPEFTSWLRLEKGVGLESREIRVKDLKPSQSELDTDKADKIWAEGNAHEFPIFVSEDGYVLDGHHRWLAVCRNDDLGSIRCQVISKPAKEALEIMHEFEKSHKIDIEDNIVESKLAKCVLTYIKEDAEPAMDGTQDSVGNIDDHLEKLGYENIHCDSVEVDEEGVVAVTLFDDEDNEMVLVFFHDEELGPAVTVVDDEDDFDSDEVDVIELPLSEMPDFTQDLSWLDEELLDEILNFDGEEDIYERSITVVRGGKKVRKKIVRKKRKKRLSAKRKMNIKKGIRKKRAKKVQIQRKRKRSLKVRKRAKLKNKPKKSRVVG